MNGKDFLKVSCSGGLWLNDACFVSCLFPTVSKSAGVFMLTYFIISNLHFRHQGTASSGPIGVKRVWSMTQYWSMFNTCKIPGLTKDELRNSFKTGTSSTCTEQVDCACIFPCGNQFAPRRFLTILIIVGIYKALIHVK